MRKIWATHLPWPTNDTVLAEAQAAGAVEIVHLPCAALPMLTPGYNEVDDGTADRVRIMRDEKLAATDWRVIKSVETGNPVSAEWRAYRQALRDVPEQAGFPENVAWPVEPA